MLMKTDFSPAMKRKCLKKRNLLQFCIIIVVTKIIIISFFQHHWIDLKSKQINLKREIHVKDPTKHLPINFIPIPTNVPLNSEENIRKYREERFRFFQDRNETGLGEGGNPSYLDDVDRKVIMDVVKKEKFNKLLSDRMSVDRRLQDYRIEECKSLKYPEKLPTASVIIVFCNEAPSVVLRTLHSVVNRTPPSYLHEVILVDDDSDREDLKIQVPVHLKEAYPDGIAKLIRSEERLGLIRARMMGAEEASGDVLVFLDAHCEVTLMWLEPLLNRIQEDKTVVVCPLIDLLSTQTLEFSRNGGGTAGGFDWSLTFDWISIQKQELERRKNETLPIKSPAMAGGLFAMDRNFFFHLGGYDVGMHIWGGENTEMSLRIWMCGGSLEFIPCSRVGHLYRSAFPYSIDNKNLNVNPKRVAEVWLDEYKRLFYLHRPELKQLDVGDLTDRKNLRKELKCRSFKWFVDNVFPELFIPDEDVLAFGSICLRYGNKCWDSLGRDSSYSSYIIGLFDDQHGASLNQLFSLDKKNKIRKESRCFMVEEKRRISTLVMENCSINEGIRVHYLKESGLLMLENGQCIESIFEEKWKQHKLILSNCELKESKSWNFQVFLG